MSKLTLVVIGLLSVSLAHADGVYVPLKGGVSEIRKHLKEAGTPELNSCIPEYIKRHEQLVRNMSLGLISVPGVPVASAGVGLGTGVALAAGQTGLAALGALGGGIILGGGVTFLAGTGVFVGEEIAGGVHLAETNRLIEVVYEAHVGEGKHLENFLKKLRKHEKARVEGRTDAELLAAIVDFDTSGELCNGKLVEKKRYHKGHKLREQLANESELMKALADK